MLTVVTGPFHPDLELALVQEIRQLKTDDPLLPLAVVVPSALLLQRLRDLLVLEQGLSLLNVHFLTFHHLALRLYDEARWQEASGQGRGEGWSPVQIELVGDLFFEYLLSRIGARALPDLAPLKLETLPPGGWKALWATVRDLKDAGVDPSRAVQAIEEGCFEAMEEPKLRALFMLSAAVSEAAQALGVVSPDDLALAMTPCVPQSAFLAGLKTVCYYGFYDLTQVQLSLFEAVASVAPVSLFFPLAKEPTFAFARRFFETYVLPRAGSVESRTHAAETAGAAGHHRSGPATSTGSAQAGSTSSPQATCRVMNAAGPDDEVTLVCKEILTLVETCSYRWNDIGVVARTLEPYRGSVRRLFDQHRIPVTSTAGAPLMREPAAKAVLQLARLPLHGFYRASVMDVLASPFYRMEPARTEGLEPRPDLWHLAVRALGITRGEDEWRRLSAAAAVEVRTDREEGDDWEIASVRIEVEQIRLLWSLVCRVIRDCRALPVRGGVSELADAFGVLLETHIRIPGLTADGSAPGANEAEGAAAGAAIRGVLQELRQFDQVGAVVTWEDWVGLFARALERATIPIAPGDHPAVRVLDAMSARGLPFRALFLLGLNEKVFPRFIHEDAFLRDRERRVLEATLGYKIDEKLRGYDEELLLFGLLRGAARDRLYLSYQRADADGRPLATSPYLTDFLPPGAEAAGAADVRLPRRFVDRLALPQFAPALLTREELSLRLVLQDANPAPVLTADDREPALFQAGWQALAQIEGEREKPGLFDGDTGTLEPHWRRLVERGLAPTPLEQYARCPFQYFAGQVLRLESIREAVSGELPPVEVGRLCHSVLRAASERLVAVGWPKHALTAEELRAETMAAAAQVFTDYAAVHGTGYALGWQLVREMVTDLAATALEQDQQDWAQTGYEPIGFEVEAEGSLDAIGPKEWRLLKVRGRLDRVDASMRSAGSPQASSGQAPSTPSTSSGQAGSGQAAVRIVDFKYRLSGRMEDKDRNLVQAAVRGFRLQPPLYVLMSVPGDGGGATRRPERVEFLFLAPQWEPPVQRSGFQAAEWHGPAAGQLRETLATILEGVQAGCFPILPDRYCDYCAFRTACRRYHGPTWWRATRAEVAQALRRMRKQKVREASNED